MRKYDTTFIIDSSLGVDEREAIIEKFSNSFEKLGGKIDQIVRWGLRTLAYEINKKSQGYYVIFYHTSDPSSVKTFEREMGLNENVLRYMTVVFDGSHPDYIRDQGIKSEASSYSKYKPESLKDIEVAVEADKKPEEAMVHNEEIMDDMLDEKSNDEDATTASDSENTDSKEDSVMSKDESESSVGEVKGSEEDSEMSKDESESSEDEVEGSEDESEDSVEDKEDM